MQESIVFLLRVQCRRKESSRSLSHLLMSFLSYYLLKKHLVFVCVCVVCVKLPGTTVWQLQTKPIIKATMQNV